MSIVHGFAVDGVYLDAGEGQFEARGGGGTGADGTLEIPTTHPAAAKEPGQTVDVEYHDLILTVDIETKVARVNRVLFHLFLPVGRPWRSNDSPTPNPASPSSSEPSNTPDP